MVNERFDVIVVGAGFGGSTCAALLAKRGLKVLLLEKNARAGGRAISLSRKGFTHTAWVVISAPTQGTLLEVVLKEVGMEKEVELVAPGVQGSRYRQSSGHYALSPQDPVPDPNKIFDWLEVKHEDREEALKLFTELTLMGPQDVNALDDITFAEWLSRYKMPRSLRAFLVGAVSDACFVVPSDMLAASEAIATIQQVFLRGGGVFCKGGFGKLADTYAKAVKKYGGKVMTRTRVEKITVEQGRVTGVLTNRGSFQAPIVVSNAGIQPTVLKLVGEEHFDKAYVNYVKDLVPSFGFMGARYFLTKKVITDPYGTIFSDDSPWDLDKWLKAKAGHIPDEMPVWYEVPSNYDPEAAPPGKQIVLTGFFCPADPQMTEKEKRRWWDKGDEIMFRVFPELPDHIEAKEYYSPREVSAIARDQVLPGQGGECIGLAQIVGQCGRHKPSPKAPIQGLFYVGCDAGGRGIGIHQATESGINVANMVFQYYRVRQAAR